MNKISINHIKGIFKYNNSSFYHGMQINLQIMSNLHRMNKGDLKFGVKNYDICYSGAEVVYLYVYHKSNKKHLSRRKQIDLDL